MYPFGEFQGRPVYCIPLADGDMTCEILTYGAAIRSLTLPDRAGTPRDLILGFDSLAEYVSHDCYFGAIVGPVANRIAGAAYELAGRTYEMTKNDGENCNHSGIAGLNARLRDVADRTERSVTLTCTHPDGLGGIPGPIEIAVTYSLLDRTLSVSYRAIGSRDTLCSLTSHGYFNLNGHDSGSIGDHRVTLYAHSYTPTDPANIPTGAIRAVAGTPMDLTRGSRLADRLDSDYEAIRNARGYDHNFLVDPRDSGGALQPAALVQGSRGISLAVYTDRPCLQLYTGNYIPQGLPGKAGAVYGPRQGLCLETQGFPDAPHHRSFPPVLLKAGQVWQSHTAYRFSVDR